MDDVTRQRLKRAFGQKLMAAMREADLCPKQIAAAFDITPTSVRNWLNGKTDPGFVRMMELAALTHRTLESLTPEDALRTLIATDNTNGDGCQIQAAASHVSVEVNAELLQLLKEQNGTLREQLVSQQQQISSQQEQISQLLKMLEAKG